MHTKEQFDIFMSQLLETNATLGFYCDFNKIKKNVSDIEISLNMLNYLLGQQDLNSAVKSLWERDKKVFEVLQILIAVRDRDNKKVVTTEGNIIPIKNYLTTCEGVIEYLEKTGLSHIFREKSINNLVDYVFGVEAGLDTHARKNRSGDLMEELVEDIFGKNGIKYKKEVYSTDYPKVHEALDGDKKRFDFVVETNSCTYLIEVNFYSDGGSKPNEVARAYTELAPKVNAVDGFTFVWITDGVGWKKAKSMITAAYMTIPNVYNLTDVKEFIHKVKEEGQKDD
jgi:type II restriction enzyme